MKNVLLKFNMVVIFLVILFANCIVQADNSAKLTLVENAQNSETGEYTYSLEVNEGRAEYVINISEEDKFIRIVSNSSNDLSYSGQAPIRVILAQGTYTVTTKSPLNTEKRYYKMGRSG